MTIIYVGLPIILMVAALYFFIKGSKKGNIADAVNEKERIKMELEQSLMEVELQFNKEIGKKVSFTSAEIHSEMIKDAKEMLKNFDISSISQIKAVIVRIKCLI